jgi:sugar/nucleoside kinase (ribokinase family)
MQLTAEDIAASKVLYVGGFGLLEAMTPERVVRMFQLARQAGVTTILDVVLPEWSDHLLSWIQQVLPWADYFFPNYDESTQLLGGDTSPITQAERFREMGAKTVVITCGGQGAILVSDAVCLKSGVYPVDPVDATGTGDAFLSGFVLGMLNGAAPERCLQWGTAMGASCVRSMGATTGVFNARQLEEFVATHSLPVEALSR